ncbi:MAG: lipopolysaccharide heptosyltransferase II [Planctomycetota bacterium]
MSSPPPVPPGLREPRKILIRLPSWVGDVVMSTPALRAVRRAHPNAEIVVEGKDYQADLVVGLDAVDRFLIDPGRGTKDVVRRGRELAAERFDWAIVLGESERVAAAPFLARIPVRAGYGRGALRKGLMTHFLERPRDLGGKLLAFSMIERYLRVTRMLGIPDAGTWMETPVTDEARAVVDERLAEVGLAPDEDLVTVVAGAAFGSAKMWPPEQFGRACDRIHEIYGWRPILAPGPGEEDLGREVVRHSKAGIALLIDPTLRLAHLAALLERSKLVLSNDTGPRSMAVSLGLPVVVPIGPTEDGHTRHHLARQRVLIEDVDCRPCRQRVCPIDHRCMTRITPDRLVAAAQELIDTVGAGADRSALVQGASQ